MLLNNDRVSRWYAGALLGWGIFFGIVGIPIFHLLLSAPIAKVAAYFGLCCGIQLAVIPWLFSARATPENPVGKTTQRIIAVIVWITVTGLTLAVALQFDQPVNPQNTLVRTIMFATPTVFGIASLIVVGVISHRRNL